MTRLEEIEKRMAEIKAEVDGENPDMDALEKEVKDLKEERRIILEKKEQRKAILDGIAKGEIGREIARFEDGKEERKMENVFDTKEYRSAYLKNLMGLKLNEVEERAMTSAANSGAAVMPTSTASEVIKRVKEYANILNEITLLTAKGNVTFAVEGVKTSGSLHAENAKINADGDTLIKVSLAGYEITKLIQVSATVGTMSIDEFEGWLVDMIVEMISEKVEDLTFNGTGTNEPTGVEKSATWTDGTNAVIIASTATLTADDVRKLFALQKYAKGAKIAMSRATLFNDFMGLQDNAKHDLVKEANGKYYVYGTEVLLSDTIAEHVAYFGNFKKVVGNLAGNIEVKHGFDIDTNSNKYLGVAIYDCKPAFEAFVKLGKASA